MDMKEVSKQIESRNKGQTWQQFSSKQKEEEKYNEQAMAEY